MVKKNDEYITEMGRGRGRKINRTTSWNSMKTVPLLVCVLRAFRSPL